MRDDPARLLDIVLACREAGEFAAGVSHQEYLADRKLQRALCMTLQIIGEAARALSDEGKAAHPEIPWRQLVSLRNRIAHEYFRLDAEIIWQIVQRELPQVLELIEPLIPPEEEA